MSKQNKGWLQIAILIALLIAMNISIEELADQKISGAEILFVRSIFNLIGALIIAAVKHKNVIPKQPKLQFGAFVCLGLSLLFFFTAYQYISAGSVTTLQRLDIPFLVIVAAISSKTNARQITLAVSAFALVAMLLILNRATDENPFGYLLVLLGVVIVSINTILQKKIAITENIETIMVIASLSSLFWGGIRFLQTNATFANLQTKYLFAIAGLAIVNLIIFYLVNDLYKRYEPEFVRYPYLIAAFGTMVIEMVVEQKVFSPVLITGNIALLVVLTLLVRSRQKTVVEVATH